MLRFLGKVLVFPFYRQHAGFFLFFFFFFFGVVEAGSLPAYHRSLIVSMLESLPILAGVFTAWFLYHLHCSAWCRRFINSAEGSFLYGLQTLSPRRQWGLYTAVHTLLYAPVLLYALVVTVYGFAKGYSGSALAVAIFQVLVVAQGTAALYRRLNGWLVARRSFTFSLFNARPKPFALYILHHFATRRRALLLALKALSLALLYIVLVLNREGYDNDSFIFFFLVILLTHTAVAFGAVQFLEGQLAFWRNLPLSLLQRAAVYVLSYAVLFLPELAYAWWQGVGITPLAVVAAYYGIAVASLFFLTAVQYSGPMNAGEYVKVVFALAFVSIFALHAQVFTLWAGILIFAGALLFGNGFYRYEPAGD